MMTRILFQIVPLRRNPIRDRTDTWPVLILLLLDKFLCIFNRILCSNYKYLFLLEIGAHVSMPDRALTRSASQSHTHFTIDTRPHCHHLVSRPRLRLS